MHKFQKGFAPLIIILIVLIVLAAGGAGFVVYKGSNRQPNNQKQGTQPEITSTTSEQVNRESQTAKSSIIENTVVSQKSGDIIKTDPINQKVAPTQDGFSGWKIYHNGKHGYEIKYPQDWDYKVGSVTPESEGFTIYSPDGNNVIIVLGLSKDGYASDMSEDMFRTIKSKEEINVNGVKGTRIIWNDGPAGMMIESPPYVYFEVPGNSLAQYAMVRFLGKGKLYETNIKIFDQMISTFKFIGAQN